jgi:mRNA interferase HicA
VNSGNFTIFVESNNKLRTMKSTELHRMFIKKGWKFDHAEGSHYFYKNKKGEMTEPVPYHGAKEMGKGIANKLIKKYGL